MPEITVSTPQAQPKVEWTGFDRLSQDPEFNDTPVSTPQPTQSATEETNKIENAANPDLPAGEPEKEEAPVNEPAKADPPAPEPSKEADDFGFKDDETTQLTVEEGSWKAVIQDLGFEIPEDFSEEKGFDYLKQLQEQTINKKIEEVKSYQIDDWFSELPEKTQAEARLVYELMKTGQSLEEINAPFEQVKQWKGMSKEALIRLNLENQPGWTEEMVNHKMEEYTSSGKIDIEYQIIMNGILQYEKDLNLNKQQQIEQYNYTQEQIRRQRRQQDVNQFKAALDRMPAFMDRKLSDENRQSVLNEYSNGEFEKLMKSAADKAEFMLYKKYGKQALQYAQARALDKAEVEKAKQQHNIPPATQGNTNRVAAQTTKPKTGIDRLSEDSRYA